MSKVAQRERERERRRIRFSTMAQASGQNVDLSVALFNSIHRDPLSQAHGQCKATSKQLPEAVIPVSSAWSLSCFVIEGDTGPETRKAAFRLVEDASGVTLLALIGREPLERVKGFRSREGEESIQMHFTTQQHRELGFKLLQAQGYVYIIGGIISFNA